MNDPWSPGDPARDEAEPEMEPEPAPPDATGVLDTAEGGSTPPASDGTAADETVNADQPVPRRADRHRRDDWAAESTRGDVLPAGRRERYPWVGLGFLVAGLVAGGIGLASIAMALDRPGAPDVAENRWWLVVGGGLAVAWASPWFLAPRGRRRMAIILSICTAVVLTAAAIGILGLRD